MRGKFRLRFLMNCTYHFTVKNFLIFAMDTTLWLCHANMWSVA